MFSKVLSRAVATLVILGLLGGCAEIDRRGGIIAEAEDYVLFVAHTKSHRLFRSYLLVGVLLAAARQGGHNDTDKLAIEANLKAALEVASEAYQCLYPSDQARIVLTSSTTAAIGSLEALNFQPPAICQFFDEKMARLDYALFRLALTTLFNDKSNVYLADIRDKLFGKIPVLSESVKAAVHANTALNQATTMVDDLLNLSFSSAGPVVTLLPLYRDSLELNMWLLVDNLTRFCALPGAKPARVNADGSVAPTFSLDAEHVCTTKEYALSIMNNGNGYLPDWRMFVRKMNDVAHGIEAFQPHLFLITKLMWRTCLSLLGGLAEPGTASQSRENRCTSMLQNALFKAQMDADLVQGGDGRFYSASLLRTRVARGRVGPAAGEPGRATARQSPRQEPEATGSITSPAVPAAR